VQLPVQAVSHHHSRHAQVAVDLQQPVANDDNSSALFRHNMCHAVDGASKD
jgi:hypothetical protein